jgi:hypothetical protein
MWHDRPTSFPPPRHVNRSSSLGSTGSSESMTADGFGFGRRIEQTARNSLKARRDVQSRPWRRYSIPTKPGIQLPQIKMKTNRRFTCQWRKTINSRENFNGMETDGVMLALSYPSDLIHQIYVLACDNTARWSLSPRQHRPSGCSKPLSFDFIAVFSPFSSFHLHLPVSLVPLPRLARFAMRR